MNLLNHRKKNHLKSNKAPSHKPLIIGGLIKKYKVKVTRTSAKALNRYEGIYLIFIK